MKKNLLSLILILILIEIPIILNSVNAYSCELYNLETDKDSYYLNEIVIINASWELNYNPLTEYAYVQINIYDSVDKLIWNSSWYDEIGFFTEQWNLNTSKLKTTFLNHSNNVLITFYLYFWDGESIHPFLKDTKNITILKRIPSCELIGFKTRINYSETLRFTARFYDNSIKEGLSINNHLVLFRVSSNNSILFQYNYTTNYSGGFELTLTSQVHLELGVNKLEFKIIQSKIYNESIFQYEIFVEKNPVFLDIIYINNPLIRDKNLLIQINCYYFFNSSITPLNNAYIQVAILNNQSLIYSHTYSTDNMGGLSITISHRTLNLTTEVEDILLIFYYNGNNFLKNRTRIFSIIINDSKLKNSLDSTVILIITFSIISLVIPIPLVYRFKKEKKTLLTEVIIKY